MDDTPRVGTSPFSDYCRSVLDVASNAAARNCLAVQRFVSSEWYRDTYFPAQKNIALVEHGNLPEGIAGAALKGAYEGRHGQMRGLYLIVIREINDPVLRKFVIAHELGHVLFHGRLMNPGMLLPLPNERWSHDDLRIQRQVEIEANLYALLSMMPALAIDELEMVIEGTVTPEILAQAMSALYGAPVDIAMARERMLAHGVSRLDAWKQSSRQLEGEFRDCILSPNASWTLNGAAGMRHDDRTETAVPLREKAVRVWKSRLITRGILLG